MKEAVILTKNEGKLIKFGQNCMYMKMILFPLILSFTFFLGNAQETVKISFESSEGYTIGSLNNQNEWVVYGPSTDHTEVVDELASDGEQLALLIGNEDVEFKGFSKEIAPLQYGSVKMDVRIYEEVGSEILFDLIDVELNTNLSINFGMDGTIWTGMGGMLTQIEDLTYEANQWYSIEFKIDAEAGKIQLYLEDEMLDEFDAPENFEINQLDNYMLDLGFGFYVDNIEITYLPVLNTQELDKVDVQVFPNPATDFITIQSNQKIENIQILDLNGRLLAKSNSSKIDVRSLAKGTYLLWYELNGKKVSTKFLKK